MAPDLAGFSEHELESFLACRELRDIYVMLPNVDSRADTLTKYIKTNVFFPRVHGKLRTTIHTVLAGHPSHMHYPFFILLGILTLTKLTFTSILLLTSIFSGMTFIVTAMYLFSSYFTINKEHHREEKILQLEIFKLHCLNEIEVRRDAENKKSYEMTLSAESRRLETEFKCKNKRSWHLAPAVGVGFFCAYTLLCTYYLSAHTVIEALGFTAAAVSMATPLGIGVAVGICALAGIYMGYRFYRYHQEKSKFDRYEKHIKQEVFARQEEVINKKNREKEYLENRLTHTSIDSRVFDKERVPLLSKENRYSPKLPFFNPPRPIKKIEPATNINKLSRSI